MEVILLGGGGRTRSVRIKVSYGAAFLLAVALLFLFASPSWAQKRQPVFPSGSFCDDVNSGLCTDLAKGTNYEGQYSGHDEPAIVFYSNKPGSGNSSVYLIRIPKDAPVKPTQDGGGTWNFQLRPAFWFSVAICDSQSDPNFTNVCEPDTDANIFDNPDPNAPDFIGKHPGVALMEFQIYPPGWVTDCFPNTWCSAMTIDSLSAKESTGQLNNLNCLQTVGEEYVNFAFLTFNGKSQAAADPLARALDPNQIAGIPDPTQVLQYNPGDLLQVFLHDTPEGFRVDVTDLTTGQHGSMTASLANGFAQINFDPSAAVCSSNPYVFHPMYSTSSEHTRVVWAAHTLNTAFSDEIGHFEWCDAISVEGGRCTLAGSNDPAGLDADDRRCFDNFGDPTLIPVIGCITTETDFDGVPYLPNSWPGGTKDANADRNLRPQPVQFTSPLFVDKNGHFKNYKRVAFEADIPAITPNPPCHHSGPLKGVGCTNPPPGAQFYPLYSTTNFLPGVCGWQLGGGNIAGTINNFGGTSTAEYGPVLVSPYINGTGSILLVENNRQILNSNPCKSGFGDDDQGDDD
jgi:hypothetical protein